MVDRTARANIPLKKSQMQTPHYLFSYFEANQLNPCSAIIEGLKVVRQL